MNDKKFLQDYFKDFYNCVDAPGIQEKIIAMREEAVKVRKQGCKIIFAGNGASASMSSHFALDFTKQGGVRSIAFNDAVLITAYGNDYGYEFWLAKAIEHYGNEGDVVVLISSSGKSQNIINAVHVAKKKNIFVITFTGFSESNLLKSKGDINFWAKSRSYNIIEAVHNIWLASVCDLLIGKSEYNVN